MAKVGRVILEIKELGGLNTTAPRGLTLQPFECVNVRFDRTGGYANQPDSKFIVDSPGVSVALWSGKANHLFLQASSNVQYHDGSSFVVVPASTGSTIGTKTVVNSTPGFALVLGGNNNLHNSQYISSTFLLNVVRPVTVAFWDGSGSTPTTPYWTYVSDTGGVFDEATETTEVMEGIVLGAGSNNKYNWFDVFEFGKGSANPQSSMVPPVTGKYDIKVAFPDAFISGASDNIGLLFWNQGVRGGFATGTVYVGATNENGGEFRIANPYSATPSQTVFPSIIFEGFFPFGKVSVYHNNRVWLGINPLVNDEGTLFAYRNDPLPQDSFESAPRTRLHYSQVVGPDTEPVWLSDDYIDPPFKVSNQIVGLASVGRYLYIFGNRELLILSGNSDADFAIESLGDSIGAVRQNTIASLGGSVYWVSDSGIMAASAGQVAEVGGDVRWTVSQMNQANLTATVDFRLELYFLTDGVTTLVFDAREKKWSTRTGTALNAGNYRLVYGGGTPYALGGGTPSALGLFNENDATGTKLTATVIWGDFENGNWDLRKTLSQITFGGQVSSGSFTLRNHSFVDGVALIEDQNTLTPSSIGKVSFVCVDSNGVQVSGNVFRVGFHFRPNDGNEGVVRGPIQVYGDVKGEEQR